MIKTRAFELALNHECKKTAAIDTARAFYEIGHRLDLVRTLVLEARLHNHAIIKLRRIANG